MHSENYGLSQQINKQNGKDEIRQLFPGKPSVSLQPGQGRYWIPPEVILLSDRLDSLSVPSQKYVPLGLKKAHRTQGCLTIPVIKVLVHPC